MKNLKQKVKKLRNHKKKNIVGISIIVICIIGVLLSLTPDLSPIFNQNPLSLIKTIHNDKHNTTPVSYLKKTALQNDTVVYDQPIPSTGCGVPLSLKTDASTYIQISSGNSERRFIVYLPRGYKNEDKHSLILAFHGYASNPFSFEDFSHFNSLADKNNIIIVYPEGTTSLVHLRGWNTGVHPTITSKDVLFVSNMLNDLQANLCINPQQIYAAGFSNGGGFTAKLACQLSNRIAAFAPVSGSYLTSFVSCTASRPVSIIEFHGTKDTVVPYLGMKSKNEIATLMWLNFWAKKDTCAPQPIVTMDSKRVTKYLWTDCDANATIVHYRITGEGHNWPHVHFTNLNEQLNAEQVIWNFFQQHPLLRNNGNSSSTISI